MNLSQLLRPKSPSRADAFAKANKIGPKYSTNVLLGNWVEDRIECPKKGTFYFPPKEVLDYKKLKPESRHTDARKNKVLGIKGHMEAVIRHDCYKKPNYASTTDLVYNHLPKPLCGANYRFYRRCKHIYYPQPDLMKCYGNVTEWGLRKYKESEWACVETYDEIFTEYGDTYVPPKIHDYLTNDERKALNSKFTKQFRYKMTKPLKPKSK